MVTYAFGDMDALYLRGQWTVHRNRPAINTIWQRCAHLAGDLEQELGKKVAALREQLRLALGGNHPESSKAVGVPADVRAAFERFDANKSGKLDYKELRSALRGGLETNGEQPLALID